MHLENLGPCTHSADVWCNNCNKVWIETPEDEFRKTLDKLNQLSYLLVVSQESKTRYEHQLQDGRNACNELYKDQKQLYDKIAKLEAENQALREVRDAAEKVSSFIDHRSWVAAQWTNIDILKQALARAKEVQK